MKIELKKIQVNKANTETSIAYSATLFVDDLRTGVATNDGQGGITCIKPFNKGSIEIIRAAQQYCEGLPPLVTVEGDDEHDEHSVPMTLELYLDELVDKFVFNQEIQKATHKGIVVGTEGERYRLYELSPCLARLLNDQPTGHKLLTNFLVDVVKPALREGERVLNTNLPEKFLSLVNPSETLTNPSSKKVHPSRSQHKGKPSSGKRGLA